MSQAMSFPSARSATASAVAQRSVPGVLQIVRSSPSGPTAAALPPHCDPFSSSIHWYPGTSARVPGEFDQPPAPFVMIGNSLRSDIAPVLELGGWGIHTPYHTTWAHEAVVDIAEDAPRLVRTASAADWFEAVARVSRMAAADR